MSYSQPDRQGWLHDFGKWMVWVIINYRYLKHAAFMLSIFSPFQSFCPPLPSPDACKKNNLTYPDLLNQTLV